jgi:hypothetical protein
MISIACIVEGHGEVQALPVLLRRVCQWLTPDLHALVLPPIRVHRDRFLRKDDEFGRVLTLAASKSGAGGAVFVLLDADDDCPASLGVEIANRAQLRIPHRHLSVVLANREYEAWFIASATSLDGQRGFSMKPGDLDVDAEGPRDAKGWMRDRMTSGLYGEVTDQPAFSARIDLQQAFDRSRSFRKLCGEWKRMVGPTT